MFVSVTRLRVRSVRFLPQFLWLTFAVQRQAENAPGLIGVRLLVDSRHTYWTLTAWETEKAMKAFRGSGSHAKAMKKLPHWCDEASYSHWIEDTPRLPEWTEGYQHLIAAPKFSRVLHPAQAHERGELPPPNFNSRFRRDFLHHNAPAM